MGHAAATHRHQTSIPGPGVAQRAATRKSPGKKKPSSTMTGTNPRGNNTPAEEYDDWAEDADLETFVAGESDWIHRDVLDPDVLDSYVAEECASDKNLYEQGGS